MIKQEKRKGGGGKLTRSETVTVRFDPRLRYLLELAARRQRRTVSSFIEWAVEESFSHVIIKEGFDEREGNYSVSVAEAASRLWDVDEADRFVKLAFIYPDMLTHEEQILWKLIRRTGSLWRGHYADLGNAEETLEWTWRVEEGNLIFDRLREYWGKFKAVAEGDMDESELPAWKKTKPKPPDDGIPF
jgi:hypothetical protein